MFRVKIEYKNKVPAIIKFSVAGGIMHKRLLLFIAGHLPSVILLPLYHKVKKTQPPHFPFVQFGGTMKM